MSSLNPGKACAQSAHAANQFAHRMLDLEKTKENKRLWADEIKAYHEWAGEKGFGTTIVVGAIHSTLKDTITEVLKENFLADLVTDETYPLLDGGSMHYFPCVTCGYVFVPSFTLMPFSLKKHKLLP